MDMLSAICKASGTLVATSALVDCPVVACTKAVSLDEVYGIAT